jgi:hypothetical protein
MDIVYFGLFETENAKEIIFRLKLLLQALHNKRRQVLEQYSNNQDNLEKFHYIWQKLRIEIIVSIDIEKEKVSNRIIELTEGLDTIPWKLVNSNDIQNTVDKIYLEIGDI